MCVQPTAPSAVQLCLYSAGDLVFVVCCTDPHIDSRSRAVEAVRIIADTIDGHIKPTMALAKPPIIPLVNMQFTARGFARELVERLSALEHAAEIAVRVPGPVCCLFLVRPHSYSWFAIADGMVALRY
eukprot:COSAG06_NODE_5895_length_3225_cov_1.698656_2_plen_128_part_00